MATDEVPGQRVRRLSKNADHAHIASVFWILRTSAPWRDLPSDYGDW